MNWEELSRDVALEAGCKPDGFSQLGQHPWVIAAIRVATLREREACAKVCDAKAGAMWAWWDARSHPEDQGRALAAEELAEEIRARHE